MHTFAASVAELEVSNGLSTTKSGITNSSWVLSFLKRDSQYPWMLHTVLSFLKRDSRYPWMLHTVWNNAKSRDAAHNCRCQDEGIVLISPPQVYTNQHPWQCHSIPLKWQIVLDYFCGPIFVDLQIDHSNPCCSRVTEDNSTISCRGRNSGCGL